MLEYAKAHNKITMGYKRLRKCKVTLRKHAPASCSISNRCLLLVVQMMGFEFTHRFAIEGMGHQNDSTIRSTTLECPTLRRVFAKPLRRHFTLSASTRTTAPAFSVAPTAKAWKNGRPTRIGLLKLPVAGPTSRGLLSRLPFAMHFFVLTTFDRGLLRTHPTAPIL
jgi:hypothetical protein